MIKGFVVLESDVKFHEIYLQTYSCTWLKDEIDGHIKKTVLNASWNSTRREIIKYRPNKIVAWCQV